jgi:hypothetical protein
MARIKDLEKSLQEFSDDIKKVFGSEFSSLILYGSGAGKEFDPKKSDLNFLLVLSETGINRLSQCFPVLKKWEKKGIAVPICVTKAYIDSSLDSFPLEFLNMKNQYRLIYGEDVLRELSFDKRYIRLQIERELKGKLLHLRQVYLETKGKLRLLRPVIVKSLTTFASIFRGILYLLEKGVPVNKREVVESAAMEMSLNDAVFHELYDIASGRKKPSLAELDRVFIRYIEEIKKAAFFIDRLEI